MANVGLIYSNVFDAYLIKEYFSDPDWDLLDPDDEEYQFCEAFGHWQEGCFDQGSN